jgi:glycosyltransferase involved in cell wall biosynthesis
MTSPSPSDVTSGGIALADLPSPPQGKRGWPWSVGPGPVVASPTDPPAWPRISVVVPSYNQGHFIEETIRSILLQGYPDVELIVMDGASTDDTVALLRRYEPWLAHWESEKDRGQTHAINKGLERSTGEIFAYLNSDDVYAPGAFYAAARAFAANPDADVVHGGCVYMTETGEETFTVRGREIDFPSYLRIWERLAKRDFITQPEVFVRRAALVEVGPFREELRSVMDFEMWLRLLVRGKRFLSIDTPLARFRMYAAQKSAVDPGDEICRVVEEYARTSGRLAPEEQESVLADLRVARAHLLVRAAIAATLLDRYRDAVAYCLRGARGYPPIVARYEFWAVLASPVKGMVPPAARRAIQRLFGVRPA